MHRNRRFDLAVIGGGPAGSLSAALAAEAGFTTVILEQKRMPRPKPCGGFVSSRALSLLPGDLDFNRLEAETAVPVHVINVIVKNRTYSYCSENKLGLLGLREHFDHRLARYACCKGALLLENHSLHRLEEFKEKGSPNPSYRLECSGPGTIPLTARYVIGADGARGRFGRLSGLRKTKGSPTGWGLSAIVETGQEEAKAGTLDFYPLPFLGGMGWSFHGPRWTNRGTGGLFKASMLQKKYRRLFQVTGEENSPAGWPLPFSGPLQKAGAGNLLLVGDAAGLVDPFSGEGLYNSFKSASLAICALVAAEGGKEPAGLIYDHLFKKHFAAQFAASLTGAILLHIRALLHPASLPRHIAGLMENKLWFNRSFNPPLTTPAGE